MKCIKCGKQGKIKVQNLEACESCFQKIIEKRVRKEIRLSKLIRKNDKILIIDDGSAESKVSEYLLKNIIKDLPVEISFKKVKFLFGKEVKGEYDKIIIPWNADKEDEYFLNSIFENKKAKYKGHYKIKEKRYLKILLPVLENEVESFAKIKKFKFNKKKEKSLVSEVIDELEDEYPEIKFSLLKSSREI